jgi:D-amino-acid oxidase
VAYRGFPPEFACWKQCVPYFRHARRDELPAGYEDGYVFSTVVVETSVYMGYLMNRFQGLGGEIVCREVSSLNEALEAAEVVVNCAGLYAGLLAGDVEVFPIRGQIVRAEKLPLDRALFDEDEEHGIAYIVPRSNDCILGGTVEVNNWSLEPDEETAQAILDRCARLSPHVRNARVIEHKVGLRPGRSTVRLEAEPQTEGRLLVHNYGHGGAGITLSWGCAEEAVALFENY